MIKVKNEFWKGTLQIAIGIYIAGIALGCSLIGVVYIWDMLRPVRPD